MSWSGSELSHGGSLPKLPGLHSDPQSPRLRNQSQEASEMQNISESQDITPELDKKRKPGASSGSKTSVIDTTHEADSTTGSSVLAPEEEEEVEPSKISAYARLDFDNYTFFVQTLQVVLGRKSGHELHTSSHHSVDVHLSSRKAISRRHAKIFYNFGTQRFEISVLGRNGAFVDDSFVGKGLTVPLVDSTKIQIGDIPFTFVLPSVDASESGSKPGNPTKFFNPTEALNLRTNLYSGSSSPKRDSSRSTPAAEPLKKQQNAARRNSKADIVRRLSIARRKSLASSSNEEISKLLKELEAINAGKIDDVGDEDDHDSAILDDDFMGLTKEELQKEEDEIDKLVKQHNLAQGVDISNDHSEPSHSNIHKSIDVDINILDQEVASLAPLIDAHSEHSQLKSSHERSSYTTNSESQNRAGFEKNRNSPYYEASDGSRATPLMGKPATIQPPANRVYGRQFVGQSQGHQAGPMAQMAQVSGTSQTGTTQYPQTYHGSPSSYTAMGFGGSIYGAYGGPPPPKLDVEVDVVSSEPASRSVMPYRAITLEHNEWEYPPICVFKSSALPTSTPSIPLRRKEGSRKLTRVHNVKDIPEQFRTKPSVSISAMISTVLRSLPAGKKGLSLSEIHDGIKDLFPYYQYCPDGWQLPVTHNVKFNKMFSAASKSTFESEWLWVVDEHYIDEKEKVRKKQQELAMAKTKEAALKSVDYRHRQGTPSYSPLGRPFMSSDSHYGGRPYGAGAGAGGSPAQYYSNSNGSVSRSLAEVASDVRREGPFSQTKYPISSYAGGIRHFGSESLAPDSERNLGTIKDQLAANRARTGSAGPSASSTGSATSTSGATDGVRSPSVGVVASATAAVAGSASSVLPKMNADTKKSLTYLQKELFSLYKARKLSYSTAITTEIITKALATTIAQVNIIGSKAGCGDNALSFLVDKAPQQVSKILDIALTKSIREKQGMSSSGSSRASTPVAQNAQKESSPTESSLSSTLRSDSTVQNTTQNRALISAPVPSVATPTAAGLSNSVLSKSETSDTGAVTPERTSTGLAKPSTFASGLTRPSFAGLSKPQTFSKSGALAKPPQFLSNKLRLGDKRSSDDNDDEAKKAVKLGE